MVLCDCYKPDGTPLNGNTRKECAQVMEKVSFVLDDDRVIRDSF